MASDQAATMSKMGAVRQLERWGLEVRRSQGGVHLTVPSSESLPKLTSLWARTHTGKSQRGRKCQDQAAEERSPWAGSQGPQCHRETMSRVKADFPTRKGRLLKSNHTFPETFCKFKAFFPSLLILLVVLFPRPKCKQLNNKAC